MNNILTGNMAGSNGKKNIHIADPANSTIYTDFISYIPIYLKKATQLKKLFWDFILSLTTRNAAVITRKKVPEDWT